MKVKKTGVISVFFVLICCLAQQSALAAISIVPAPPKVHAKSYLLVDAVSGQVLVEDNADQALPPASLTKLMTSYVLAYEMAQGNVKEDDTTTISKAAWAKNFPGSSLMWIEVGTQVSLGDLHRGLVISSGNDASVAIAEHLAGTEEAFADSMNKHAEALGMSGTHYMNSHGLPDKDHYTTARDLSILAKAVITSFPIEYALYREREFTYNNIKQPNRNRLLWRDSSVDGLKTGHTEEAGYCLVASAKRDEMRLISVVMGASSEESRTRETQKLLSYGFRFFETHKLYSGDEKVSDARVWGGTTEQVPLGVQEDIYLTLPKGKHSDLQVNFVIDEEIRAPVQTNERYGTLVVALADKTLTEKPLIALESVDQSGFFARSWDTIVMHTKSLIASMF
ncbi:MAG: D-alanyl-D-alanine carboxypeptidase family protein [Pseudomonadales bacterium]